MKQSVEILQGNMLSNLLSLRREIKCYLSYIYYNKSNQPNQIFLNWQPLNVKTNNIDLIYYNGDICPNAKHMLRLW